MTASSRRPADAGPLLPRLYAIIDADLCRLRNVDPLRLADACASGGVPLVQVRQKASGSGSFLSLIEDVIARTAAAGGQVIVNDRADLARMAGAAGVHVGQQDLEPPVVRAIVGPDALIGLSTHTIEQIDAALTGDVDYVAVGPVFRTSTKDTGYDPRGLEMIRYAAGRGKPIVAIGGITLDNAPAILRAGAASVAVISDLLTEADPEIRVRQYLDRLDRV